MLTHEGDTRTIVHDLSLAAVLSFIAGAVNSAGFVAFGFLSANMTGNISMVSDHLGTGAWHLAGAFALVVVAFVTGSFGAIVLIEVGKRRGVRHIYSLILIAEAALLLLAGSVAALEVGGVAVVGLLACAMGAQNAASTRISGSRLRTTHLSGVLTDIGASLALVLHGAGDQRRRLITYLCTVFAFLMGGFFGIVASAASFPICAMLLFALSFLDWQRRP